MLKQVREQKLFAVSLLLILIDQFTKIWIKGFHLFGFAHEGMPLNSSRDVLGDFLRFSYVENPGMAFGVEFGAAKIFLSLFSVVAAIALGWYLYKLRHSNIWVQLGIMLLLSGAVGNLIDRVFYGLIFSEAPLFYGKVVDFLDVDCFDFSLFGHTYTRWWVFNVADSCVSCGIVLLLLFNNRIPSLKSLDSRNYIHDGPVVMYPYTHEWAAQFAELKAVLMQALGTNVITVEHVGSTAVPGMVAKNILDVDIVIDSPDHFDTVRTTLEALGYKHEGDKGIAWREAFRQSDAMVPYGSGHRWMRQHVYVCPADSPALNEHRLLRDALLASEELRTAYSSLKQDLAQRFANDRDAYTEGKTEFVQNVLKEAQKGQNESPMEA